MRDLSIVDQWLSSANRALSVLGGSPQSARDYPGAPSSAPHSGSELSAAERAESEALMRVNHVGEVCAQALYEAHAIGARNAQLRALFRAAAEEELDHLAWTQQRINELGGRTSWLNPVWHAGSFAIGLAVAGLGDRASLAFMAETERQVEAHLQSHLERLPVADTPSRQVVDAMKRDEAKHAEHATELGGVVPPWPVRAAMRLAARLMTRTAHRI